MPSFWRLLRRNGFLAACFLAMAGLAHASGVQLAVADTAEGENRGPGVLLLERILESSRDRVQVVPYMTPPARSGVSLRIMVIHLETNPEAGIISIPLSRARFAGAVDDASEHWRPYIREVAAASFTPARKVDEPLDGVLVDAMLVGVEVYDRHDPAQRCSFYLPLYAETKRPAGTRVSLTDSKAWHIVEGQVRRLVDMAVLRANGR